MQVVVRNVGERIVASAATVVTILAVRDTAVLLGIEPVAMAQPQEGKTSMPTHEATAACRPSGD